ncbi:MAG: ATP-binding protein [Pseudomonadota bacterium]
MSAPRRSLLRRLLLGFAGVAMLLWACLMGWTIHEMVQVDHQFARLQLRSSARQVMAALRAMPDRPDQMQHYAAQVEQSQDELYGKMNMLLSPFRVQVWRGDTLVYVSTRLPEARPGAAEIGRVATLPASGDLAWTETDGPLTVRVAQESLSRFAMSMTSVGFYLLPLLVSLPFLLLPAWFIVRHGLRPLTEVVACIEERGDADLAPLAASDYRELAPLVAAINRLMARLGARLAREQEFLHDAAHELKTPLAVILVNAESLAQAPTAQRAREAGAGLAQGVARATRSVHQLLELARTDADRDQAARLPLDLAQLLRERLADAMPMALARGIELALLAPDSCTLSLHHDSCAALIDNLIDNAVKYSPSGSCVELSLRTIDGALRLEVADSGPGIAPEWRAKVFERFFRMPGVEQPGSGLGLAIAQRAAARNGAGLVLDGHPDGARGLRAVVMFS